MGKHLQAAAALVSSLEEPGERPLTRTQVRILAYLAKRGCIYPHGFSRSDLSFIAQQYRVSLSLVEHQMKMLIDRGHVTAWVDAWGITQYAIAHAGREEPPP